MSLPDLAAVLWRQRDLLERLVYRLECEHLLLAAGHAPVFEQHDLEDPEMAPVRRAIDLILDGHDPYPAVVDGRIEGQHVAAVDAENQYVVYAGFWHPVRRRTYAASRRGDPRTGGDRRGPHSSGSRIQSTM